MAPFQIDSGGVAAAVVVIAATPPESGKDVKRCVLVVSAALNHRLYAGMPSAFSSLMPRHVVDTIVVLADQVSGESEIITN